MFSRVVRRISKSLVERCTRVRPSDELVRLGNEYGGWWLPLSKFDSSSVCYLAGVGEDVSFDLALIEKVGCDIWALDPTPRSVAFAETIQEPRFHFIPVGLWREDATLRFYAPRDPAHVSHSALNLQGTSDYFEADCRSVGSLMETLGHARIDLLKLDIEGSEVAVIEDLLANGPLPKVLCVEFDAIEPPWRTLGRISRLSSAGYTCRHIEGSNYTFTLDV